MKQLIGFIILLLTLSGFSQEKFYKIEIETDGFNDSVYYLVSYYADKYQVIDTSFLKSNNIQFLGDSLLHGGIYILAGEKMNKYFEFLIDKDQDFEISVSRNQIIESITARESTENTHFFEYLRFNNITFEKIKFEKEKLTNSENIRETKQINKNIEELNSEVVSYKSNFIEKHPEELLSIIFLGMQEPEIDKQLSKQLSYQSFKKQYWDKINLTDPRMIRTPILHNKLVNYFDKIIVQHPDSLIAEIDRILKQPLAKEIKNHFIWHLTLKYEYPDIMGLDKVFVHMVQNYFHTKKITGISQNIIDNIEKRAKKIEQVLIGKKAADLIMMDTSNKPQSLYNLNSEYTLVFFWDQECQTCQKEIILLRDLLSENIFDLKVFAVGTDSKLNEWKKYIVDNTLKMIHVNGTQSFSADYHTLYDIYSTPTAYLLDKNKFIIAKRLSINQIKNFIQNHLKNNL